MKNALKAAFPTVLAIVLAFVAIEGLKMAKARFDAEQAAKKMRASQAAAAAAALAHDESDEG